MKVKYIMGRGRSGSTFLEGVIATTEKSIGIGEARLWPICYNDEHVCSCGKVKVVCKFWKNVFMKIEGSNSAKRSFNFLMSRKSVLVLFMPIFIIDYIFPVLRKDLEEYYLSISEVASNSAVVDSSKNPAYGFLLSTLPSVDLEVHYLYRNPMGVVYSWLRQQTRSESYVLYKIKKNTAVASLEWSTSNLFCMLSILRCKGFVYFQKYEMLEGVTKKTEASRKQHGLEESTWHSMAGNPGVQSKSHQFKVDEEWKSQMSLKDKVICILLTAPIRMLIQMVSIKAKKYA